MEKLLESLLFSIFFVLPIIAALTCLYYAFRYLYQIRLIQDTPTSKIRSAAQGYVELSGTTYPLKNEVLISTITQTPCLWYRYVIEEWRTFQTNEGPKSAYQFLHQQESDDFFILRDNSGECIINPKGAVIIANHHTITYGYTPIPQRIYRWSFLFWLFGNPPTYRYRESRIHFDEPLQVNGSFKTLDKNDAIVQENAFLSHYLQEKNQPSLHWVSNEDLPHNHLFLLTAISHTQVIRQYRWKAVFFLAVFVLFSYVTVHSMYSAVQQILSDWYQSHSQQFFR